MTLPTLLGTVELVPTCQVLVWPSVVYATLNWSPVTLLRTQKALPTSSAFSWASLNWVPPFALRSATVRPARAFLRASALGVYQIGDVQARSCPVSGTTSGGGTPACTAWISVQRGVGISSTRA